MIILLAEYSAPGARKKEHAKNQQMGVEYSAPGASKEEHEQGK